MMREKGGGDMDSPLGGLQSGRAPGADYYSLSGWQAHSPSPRLDLDALPSRMLASVPPLSKSPFSAASLSRPPDRAYSAGMESALDRDSALYNRSPLTAGYRSSADLMYNGEQPHPSLPMPAYHSSKDAGYLGLTCPDGSGGALYSRSVLENSLFNRSLSMASLPSNPALVPNYRSHLGSSGDDFSMERPLERKFVFGSSHAQNALLSSHPYNRLLENYSEHVSSAGKGNLESSAPDRTGAHYTSPHAAFSTGSSYINRNSPLYPFSHLGTSFPPESYTSYASSLSHLSNYGQLSAPPPAHSRAHDAVTQRPAFAEEENKQREGSASQPFDATMSREFNVPTLQWDHASISDSKKKNSMAAFEGPAQSSDPSVTDPQCKCYQDSPALPLPKEEDGLEQLMDNQFVVVGSQEKMVTAQNEACEQISRCTPCQGNTSWSMSGMRYTQSTPALPSVSGTNPAQPSAAGMDMNSSENFIPQQQQAGYSVNTSQHAATTFLPGSQPAVFPAKFSSPVSATSCSSYTASRGNNRASCQFSEPSAPLYTGNGTDVDSDLEEKLQLQRASQAGRKGSGLVSTSANTEPRGEGGFPFNVTSRAALTKTPRAEAPLYDSSTSEYEPPSPYQESVKKRKRGKKRGVTVRKQTITTSFQDDPHEVDLHSSKIKLTIKTEKVVAMPTRKATGEARSRRAPAGRRRRKKGAAQKENLAGRSSNKTCPLCLKTFSRADSLTCHMRVHTGDRPYHCDQCSASYKVSSHLRDHIRSKHSDAKPFECEKCGKPFTYSTARRRHEKICGKDLAERVEYQCFTCNKGFVTAKGFSKHQEKCGIPNPDDGEGKGEHMTYKCKNCRKVFDSLPSLDGHQRFFCGKTKSLQVDHFSCSECGKAFFKRNLYIVHMRHHAGGKPFRCVQCEGSFYGKDTLKQHMEQHKENQKFKCSSCDAAFFLKRCLSLHSRRVHGALKPYKCKECEWNFSSGYHRCKHLRTVHCQVKQFKYVLVGRGFTGASFWMKQRRWHPVRDQVTRHHTCKLCHRSFTLKEMQSHVLAEHPGVTLNEALSKRPARCGLCAKDFSCQESLRVHRLQHKGKKPFQCNRCGMAFLLKSVLRLHQRSKHEDFQPHSCPECEQTFRWNASVRQHMIAHHGLKMENGENGNKRFTCTMCGQQFQQQIFLNVHMKRHTAAMPNICSQCGKGFVDSRHLKLHMARHEGPKSFVCEKCGAVFSTRSRLYGHTRSRHADQPRREWLCDECGKSLCRRDSLLKHMAVHAKNHSDLIPKKGRRKGSKLTKSRDWRKMAAAHDLESMTAGLPGSAPEDSGNSKFAVPANVYGMSEADLADLKPTNFIPPNLGASPSLGVVPSFGAAAARFSAAPGFASPPHSVSQHQPTPEHFNYQYQYNTYVNHNIPCPNGANQ